jgi:hypothetical protein
MNDENTALLNGYAASVKDALVKQHGSRAAEAIVGAMQAGGGFTQDELMAAANNLTPEQMAQGMTDAAMSGKLREDPNDWCTPGKAQLDDRTWYELRAKQKAERAKR